MQQVNVNLEQLFSSWTNSPVKPPPPPGLELHHRSSNHNNSSNSIWSQSGSSSSATNPPPKMLTEADLLGVSEQAKCTNTSTASNASSWCSSSSNVEVLSKLFASSSLSSASTSSQKTLSASIQTMASCNTATVPPGTRRQLPIASGAVTGHQPPVRLDAMERQEQQNEQARASWIESSSPAVTSLGSVWPQVASSPSFQCARNNQVDLLSKLFGQSKLGSMAGQAPPNVPAEVVMVPSPSVTPSIGPIASSPDDLLQKLTKPSPAELLIATEPSISTATSNAGAPNQQHAQSTLQHSNALAPSIVQQPSATDGDVFAKLQMLASGNPNRNSFREACVATPSPATGNGLLQKLTQPSTASPSATPSSSSSKKGNLKKGKKSVNGTAEPSTITTTPSSRPKILDPVLPDPIWIPQRKDSGQETNGACGSAPELENLLAKLASHMPRQSVEPPVVSNVSYSQTLCQLLGIKSVESPSPGSSAANSQTGEPTKTPSPALDDAGDDDDLPRNLPISSDILDDLAMRFVVNLPVEDRQDPIRLCFQIETAYWFYTDFYCEAIPTLPRMKLKRFASIMFTYIPSLRSLLVDFDEVINKWIKYKFSVPCSGAIMLDEGLENVLLVQGFGSKNWSFPKGKVNHDESLVHCAIREVHEETGYDCTSKVIEDHFLERKVWESQVRLYLVRGVEPDFAFQPHVRNEIRDIKWFSIRDLPHRVQKGPGRVAQSAKFLSVIPFVAAIRKWIDQERKRQKKEAKMARRKERKRNTSNETSGSDETVPLVVLQDTSTTSFVDVKLDDILDLSIYSENGMINPTNDLSFTGQQPSNGVVGGGDGGGVTPTPLPMMAAVTRLEDLEREMLKQPEPAPPPPLPQPPTQANDLISLLGSSEKTCSEKLNLLFGLAQGNSTSPALSNGAASNQSGQVSVMTPPPPPRMMTPSGKEAAKPTPPLVNCFEQPAKNAPKKLENGLPVKPLAHKMIKPKMVPNGKIKYNGLSPKSVAIVHPKVEQLLQLLKAQAM